DGTYAWGTYYGGAKAEAEYTSAVAVSPVDGSVYLVGGTTSTNNIWSSTTQGTSYSGGAGDAFIAKFNPSGVRQWGRYFGGSGDDGRISASVAVDENGYLYIAGYTFSTDLPVINAYQSTHGGGTRDLYIARFDPSNGNTIWATYYGGSNDEPHDYFYSSNLLCAKGGKVTAIAGTNSTGLASPGAFKVAPDNIDVIIVCFDVSGIRQWATYYGGSAGDHGSGCAVDEAGNIYASGRTTFCDGIATVGAYQTFHAGSSDAFIAKFSASGSLIWGSYFGGWGQDGLRGPSCAVYSSDGSVYLAGRLQNVQCGIGTVGAHLPTQPTTNTLNISIFLAKFCQGGSGCVSGTHANPCTSSWSCGVLAYSLSESKPDSVKRPDGLYLVNHPSSQPRLLLPAEAEEGYEWVLYDVLGRRLQAGQAAVRELHIDLRGYPAGRYMLAITGRRLWQVVVEKPAD
ncbi:MAG: SBBP repeat-containing protein, partial [Bacteroidia bacterium]|nr:SBBP repeat-containing protein [Bacteroidia bacterium]